MIDILIFVVMTSFYFHCDGNETSRKEASLSIAVYASYLLIYLFVPPFPAMSSKHLGQLYGFLPMFSFAAILFPHFNPKAPEVVTRALGWSGLLLTFFLLGYCKVFVW